MKMSVEEAETTPFVGVALIKDDKMIGHLGEVETLGLTMLLDEFHRGILSLPCQKEQGGNIVDFVEIFLLESTVSPRFEQGQVIVDVSIDLKVNLRELLCDETVLETVDDVEDYAERIEEQIEKNLMKTLTKLQGRKVDVINIGNKIYQEDPQLWNSIKDNWDDLFSQSQFNWNISAGIEGSGIIMQKPFLKNDD